jgi:primosomal protein N' (replication factor Y)
MRAADSISSADLDAMHPGWRVAARALKQRGWLGLELLPDDALPALTGPTGTLEAGPVLTSEQSQAIESINASAGRFTCTVLQGVTGSGKTEVYLQAVAATLARGASALVLVPEIGLTPQLVGRFRARFATTLAVMHSGLGEGERLAAWRSAWSGDARIVIGTRSAVFAPLTRLGLVIVDEEHDSSFKQHEGGCRYSARDLAVRRAQQGSVPVVLGSATPALETLHNVSTGRYQRLLLPRRDDQAAAPRLALIDLRTQSVRAGISGAVIQAIERHLASAGQVIVYINRRGYAPTLLCTSCGWIAPCHACDARLTVHHGAQRLRCHHCGADEPLPQRCGRCGFAVKPVGQGTERVEQTLAELFPKQSLLRLDRDTARTSQELEAVMQAVMSGAARILVGTQMVTKGHHFPGVTLVVVLNADQGLFSTDFRAAERLAQTIVQVAGRAGRAERAGEVLVQTEYPDHPLLQSLVSGGYEAFAASALAERAAARWPPFARIALLRASAPGNEQVMGFLTAARESAGADTERTAHVKLLGPVNATMARRAGRFHAQLLIESPDRGSLQRFLHHWVTVVEQLPAVRQVRWALDVDPLDTQ